MEPLFWYLPFVYTFLFCMFIFNLLTIFNKNQLSGGSEKLRIRVLCFSWGATWEKEIEWWYLLVASLKFVSYPRIQREYHTWDTKSFNSKPEELTSLKYILYSPFLAYYHSLRVDIKQKFQQKPILQQRKQKTKQSLLMCANYSRKF